MVATGVAGGLGAVAIGLDLQPWLRITAVMVSLTLIVILLVLRRRDVERSS